MIPDWLDAESLRWVIVGAIGLLAVAAVMMMRFVRRALMRLVVLAVFAGLSIGLWQERASLQDCVETCSCQLLGQQVNIPAEKNPKCWEVTSVVEDILTEDVLTENRLTEDLLPQTGGD